MMNAEGRQSVEVALAQRFGDASFGVSITLNEYIIKDQRNWDGNCCDERTNNSICESNQCDLYFRFCVEPLPGYERLGSSLLFNPMRFFRASDQVSVCSTGWRGTGVFHTDTNKVQFPKNRDFGNWSSPRTVNFTGPFEVRLHNSFIHRDPNETELFCLGNQIENAGS